MSEKSALTVCGHSFTGWPATFLLVAIWFAPALLVALMILRLKMTCGN